MIQFWGFPVSFNSRKVHWTLEELGVPYTPHVVDLMTGAHRQPPFLAINPLGRVPVIEDGEVRLIESNAIVWYLAERYGSELLPAGAAERAQVQAQLQLNANHLRPALQNPWRMKWISPLIGEPHDPAQLPGLIAEAKPWLAYLEQMLAGREWLVGKQLSVADLCLAPIVECAPQLGLPLAPATAAWMDRIRARPAYAKTAPPPLPQ